MLHTSPSGKQVTQQPDATQENQEIRRRWQSELVFVGQGGCRKLRHRPHDGLYRPQFHALLAAGSPKQTGVGAASHRGWPGCGWAVTVSGMPFKHNAARRHRIPKTRYRVQNWPAYEAGLKRRGDLTLWLDEAALAKWQAPRRTTPGGQARYSD